MKINSVLGFITINFNEEDENFNCAEKKENSYFSFDFCHMLVSTGQIQLWRSEQGVHPLLQWSELSISFDEHDGKPSLEVV